MSSDDDLDYMSAEVLENCVKDVRPDLIQSHSHRRYHNIYKKHVVDKKSREQQRPKKWVKSNRREEELKDSRERNKRFRDPEMLENCAKGDTRPGLIHSHSHKRYDDYQKKKQVINEKNRQHSQSRPVESKGREERLKQPIRGGKGFSKPKQAKASSDEELDYMSAEILENCVKEDIRPGLIYNHSHKRYHDIRKKKQITDEQNKQRHRPKKLVETQRRDEGLKEAIAGDNKGFALLQKMGYKPGTAIGKSGTGRTEPVPINIKAGREGLGRETALKEIAEEKLAIRRRLALQREKECNPDDYRARMMKKVAERQIEADLRKSQKICENLDRAMSIDEPAENFFWPTPINKEAEDDEDSEEKGSEEKEEEDQELELETPEKLEILTHYLRRTYNYCIWCAVQYDDEKDLQEGCPGRTREDHE